MSGESWYTTLKVCDALEAHMISHVLEAENIPSMIQGEYLQGAVGGLPVTDLVRVSVEEHDLEKAQQILREYEAAHRQETRDQAATVKKGDFTLSRILFFLCLLLLILLAGL